MLNLEIILLLPSKITTEYFLEFLFKSTIVSSLTGLGKIELINLFSVMDKFSEFISNTISKTPVRIPFSFSDNEIILSCAFSPMPKNLLVWKSLLQNKAEFIQVLF